MLYWLLGGCAAVASLPVVRLVTLRMSGETWPPDSVQADWRFCQKCQSMFFDGYPTKGICPAGGAHNAKGYNFVLPHK